MIVDVVVVVDVVGDGDGISPPRRLGRQSMPHGGFATAVLDGVAHAVGGEEPARALDTAEALDLPDGAWRTIAPVPTPRHGHAMTAAAGRVSVIGGADRPIFAAVDGVESFAPTR